MAYDHDKTTTAVLDHVDTEHEEPGGGPALATKQGDPIQGSAPPVGLRYYPGPWNNGAGEAGNETGLNGDTPAAGDIDPGATESAEETGQDGDPTERKKSMGHPWDG